MGRSLKRTLKEFQKSLKPPVIANGPLTLKPVVAQSIGLVEGFSQPHPDFCAAIHIPAKRGMDNNSTCSEQSGRGPDEFKIMGPTAQDNHIIPHTLCIGARAEAYRLKPFLSIYVSTITNIKLSTMVCVEITMDDKNSAKTGWYESGNIKTTFCFDRFHLTHSYLRIILWQKRKLSSNLLQRDDLILGECLVVTAELEDIPSSDPNTLVRYLRINGKPLNAKDRFGGAKLYGEIIVTIPRPFTNPRPRLMIEHATQTEALGPAKIETPLDRQTTPEELIKSLREKSATVDVPLGAMEPVLHFDPLESPTGDESTLEKLEDLEQLNKNVDGSVKSASNWPPWPDECGA